MILQNGQTYSGGQQSWNVDILGSGDLQVAGEQFTRTRASVVLTDTAAIHNVTFPAFTSGSWILRATIQGTSSYSSGSYNYVTMDCKGIDGSYGCRILLNRTDPNPDLNFGQDGAYNNFFYSNVFTNNQLVNREMELTLVNKESLVNLFVDDWLGSATPTNVLYRSNPTSGTIKLSTWNEADVTFGSQMTGSVDNIQLFNVIPYIESFTTTTTTIDPIPAASVWDNSWQVLDANNPVNWEIQNSQLQWKGSASDPPYITSQSSETDFTSDSWIFEATFTLQNASNSPANRVIFEIEPASGPAVGVVIPKTNIGGARLEVYENTESNVLASDPGGTDLAPFFRHRVSIYNNHGEIIMRVDDRRLDAGVALGLGTLNWKRINVKGDAAYGFAVDSVLFFNAGSGLQAVSPMWMEYE